MTSDRRRIPLDSFDNAERGSWRFESPGNGPSDIRFCCPICGCRSLMTNHSVDQDGTVNASVACNGRKWLGEDNGREPCDYHEWVILDQWPSNWSKQAGQLALPAAGGET